MSKLVRDKIPEIIGDNAKVRVLNDEEYSTALKNKLTEEYNEYIESENPEELADIFEVILAIAENKKVDLYKLRENKKEARGAFEKRYFLENN